MKNVKDMSREQLRGIRSELMDKGLRSGYDDRMIDQIEAELDRRARWEAEKDMQALAQQIDPDGLDEQGQAAWNDLQRETAIEDDFSDLEEGPQEVKSKKSDRVPDGSIPIHPYEGFKLL